MNDRDAYRAHVIAERDRLRAEARVMEHEIGRLNAEDRAATLAVSDYETWSQIEARLMECRELLPGRSACGSIADLLRDTLDQTRLHKIAAFNRQAAARSEAAREREREATR